MNKELLARSRGMIVLLVLALVVVSCGGDGGATTTVGTTEPAETTAAPTETTEAPTETTAAAGGDITFDVGVTEYGSPGLDRVTARRSDSGTTGFASVRTIDTERSTPRGPSVMAGCSTTHASPGVDRAASSVYSGTASTE